LREGLDMPEVSLVAILDADKEGFLRSERSLIQTIGRAARNLNGKAILYADKITNSMQRAIAETDRRREKQILFNKQHNITPIGIQKAINDILETHQETVERPTFVLPKNFEMLSPDDLAKKIKKLEKEMFKLASNLEFEKAATTRDLIKQLRNQLFY